MDTEYLRWEQDMAGLVNEEVADIRSQGPDYGIADVARIIEMSRESVRRYIQSGMLPARKEGKSFKVRPADLYEFLKSDRLRRLEVK